MNPFNINLTNRVVLLKPEFHGGTEEERKFLCERGFGLQPFAHGSKITGTLLVNNSIMMIDADTDIEDLWVEAPVEHHNPTALKELPHDTIEEAKAKAEASPGHMAMSPQVAEMLRDDCPPGDEEAKAAVEEIVSTHAVLTPEQVQKANEPPVSEPIPEPEPEKKPEPEKPREQHQQREGKKRK